MTKKELEKMAEDFELNQHFSYEEGATSEGYQEGFKKALELVAESVENTDSLPYSLVQLLESVGVEIKWGYKN